MQPSADGQEQVIRKAYLRAGLTPDETDYVEVSYTVQLTNDTRGSDLIDQ